VPSSAPKYTLPEIIEHYKAIHHQALEADRLDSIAPVIYPQGNYWINRFTDYAHRLGMAKAFTFLHSAVGSLAGSTVLDLGCGRGRWVHEYAARGARVTGVDVSPDAIAALSREMPHHRFLCHDITRLSLPGEAFDVVNCVTVLQHLPEPEQRRVLTIAYQVLKPGGYFVLLENTSDFVSVDVHAHSREEWMCLVENAGLVSCWKSGSNFEPLFRCWRAVLRLRNQPAAPAGLRGAARRRRQSMPGLNRTLRTAGALASFPLEWLLTRLPIAKPTHAVMVFRKPDLLQHQPQFS